MTGSSRDSGTRDAPAPGAVRILVVDDTPTMLLLTMRILGAAGYEVTATGDPREGPALAREHHPDLFLVDLFMPHLDGVAVAQALAEEYGGDGPPVVLMTGEDTADTRRRADEAGIRAILGKPFDVAGLLACVAGVLLADAPRRARSGRG